MLRIFGIVSVKASHRLVRLRQYTDTLNVKIGAEVAGFEPSDYFDKRQLGMLDRFSQFGLVAAREAVSDLGISFDGEAGERAAAIIGSGVGGQTTLDNSYYAIYAEKRRVYIRSPCRVL